MFHASTTRCGCVQWLQASRERADNKCAVFLLRRALSSAAAEQLPWSAFLALYGLLDEHALHLIQACTSDWPFIEHLLALFIWQLMCHR